METLSTSILDALRGEPWRNTGGIVLLSGPSASGKSATLCKIFARLSPYSGCAFFAYHTGSSRRAASQLPATTMYTRTVNSAAFIAVCRTVKYVFIDDVQWFLSDGPADVCNTLQKMVDAFDTVFLVGALNTDHRMHAMPGLLELDAAACTVYQLYAVCSACRRRAPFTRASKDGAYQPVCFVHHPYGGSRRRAESM